MSGLYSAALAAYIPTVTFSRLSITVAKGCKNDRKGLVSSPASCIQPVEKVIRKIGQKPEEKINAKIEDVVVIED